MGEEKKLIEISNIAKMKCKELLRYSQQEETGKVAKRNAKTMEELVDEIIMRNNISGILERFDPKDNIKRVAIDIGNEFERREKEGEIKLNKSDKNRKATAIAALSIALEKHLPQLQWLQGKINLSNNSLEKKVAKRKEIMKEFDVIKKK